MSWITTLGIILFMIGCTYYEWPNLRNKVKEKKAYVILSSITLVITLFITFIPDLPGPVYLYNKWIGK
ncbi:hypothetical protein SAMN05444392_11340 [Seinonella peptonophila]|uniref:Uncharacterized protein n=1 Tax=Seinonella peptonophila TaxID=112248 RepID=A0A1M5ACU3_9BACL|nr:hypothetical protein [Seinonella peptonophila]SHF28161.1 hypothetical protein SAMN05444392_11340 [Seinonella peptonophila]